MSDIVFLTDKECPVCKNSFQTEKLHSKKILRRDSTPMLRSLYEEDYEDKQPLYYDVVVCPECLYAFFDADYKLKPLKRISNPLYIERRKKILRTHNLEEGDLKEFPRPLKLVAVEYLLVVESYDCLRVNDFPNTKRAIASLRAAWCFEDIAKTFPDKEGYYRQLATEWYFRAESFYEIAFLKESFDRRFNYGPDVDFNFSFSSIPYLLGFFSEMRFYSARPSSSVRSFNLNKAIHFYKTAYRNRTISKEEKAALMAGYRMFDLEKIQKEGVIMPARKSKKPSSSNILDLEEMNKVLNMEILFSRFGETFKKNEIIVKENESSVDMYFILKGKVSIQKQYLDTTGEYKKYELAKLGEGTFFGEMSMLLNQPRLASAVADTEVKLIKLNLTNLSIIIRTYPFLAVQMLAVLSRRIHKMDRYIDQNIFKNAQKTIVNEPNEENASLQISLKKELMGLMNEI